MVAQKLNGWGKRAYVRHFSAERTKFPLSLLLHHTVKGSIQLRNLTTSTPVFPLIANFFLFLVRKIGWKYEEKKTDEKSYNQGFQ